jgi:hypothetical protein
MTKVFVAQHPTEAHFLKGVLANSGIPSEVRREALFGARGEVPLWECLPEIWVENDDQADEAREILKSQSAESEEAKGQSWVCPNCGETVEPQFTACWKCNEEKPDPANSSPFC